MSAAAAPAASSMADGQRRVIFLASIMALITTAMSFAIRGGIINEVGTEFGLDDVQKGWINGAWAWGFAGAILFGSPLCDILKMSRVMFLAFLAHVVGFLMFIFAVPGSFAMLFAGTLIGGCGNGLVEAAINPLVATMYPKEKVAKLNLLHAWFPGGIVLGALVAFGLDRVGFTGIASLGLKAWQCKMGILLIPAVIYALMFAGRKLPETERVESGVSTGDMWKEVLRPAFILLAVMMAFTGATELGPGGWITAITERSVQSLATASILVLAFINLVMCVCRFFAGPIAHKLSPPGIIAACAVVAAVGLLMMSQAKDAGMAFLSAGIFGLGVCLFWPTMLAIASERFPKGGALALGVLGAMGNIGTALAGPVMGGVMESAKKGYATLEPKAAEAAAMPQALAAMVVLPIVVAVVFFGIVLWDRSRGGYKAIHLEGPPAPVED